MGNFEIIQRNGNKIQLFSREPFCVLKSATQNTSLMGDDSVQLSFVSDTIFTFGKGDKIVIDGEEYTLRTKVKREMYSDTHFVYDATFYGVMYELMKCIYRDTDEQGKSSRSTFDLTYTICDFVRVIVYNMNRDYPGMWKFNEKDCPETEARTISFSRNNCLQVLQTLCSENEFNLEFLITQEDGVRTIHIGKFGSKVNPPSGSDFFEWGKGNGLFSLKEEKVDDKAIITRLWVEGGTNNIRSDYRDYSERLQLPFPKRKNKREHKLWDGTVVPANSEMIGIDDDSKRYLEDAYLKDSLGSEEDAVVYDDIYPKRTGKVTALIDGDINSFIDDTMDFDLCEKDDKGTKYLISEVNAKITFISGKLAGQQFEIAQKGGYEHAAKKFKLIPFTDSRGLTIPTAESEAYRLNVGDTYKITDINLPESYEHDAEEDLWYAGLNEFKPRTQARAQYGLSFDRSYFINNLPSDSRTTIFRVGDYVPVKDVRFGLEKNIRIQKIKRNLLNCHDYELTLSDIVAVSIISQTVVDVGRIENIIEGNNLKDLAKARRGWRTTEELRNMVYDTDGYFDPENIKPNSIDTNMLTVGSKSQQFVLVGVVLEANKNGNPNLFSISAGTLAHLTIDEDNVKHWNLSAASYTMSEAGGYYVFAKCSKKGNNGVWYITQEQLKVEIVSDPNNYYFQIGIIGSLNPDDNFRDFTTTYGFTRINGNTITTGKIITSDKECYLDLDGNKFRIGDSASSIDWNVTAKRQLTLHNVRLLSDSGDTSHLGVFRGAYNDKYVYYAGDEVSYTYNGETCTYRYINPNPSMGNKPTDSVYWAVVAKGSQGEKGESPAAVFVGVYSSSKTYIGNKYRIDVVKYNGIFYVARIDAGSFSGIIPTNTSKWNPFGAQFESVATNLLLAENANIANFIFRNQRMESQDSTGGTPNIILDGLKNIASFAAGKVFFDRDNAKIGWLQIVENDLVGYDKDKTERIRISNSNLPNIDSLTKYEYINCTYEYPNDAYFDEEYLEVTRDGFRYEIRDDWGGGTSVDEDNLIWIDLKFSIEDDDTVIDFDFQSGVSAQIDSVDRWINVKNSLNTTVASSDYESLSTKLNKGNYKATFYARFNSTRDWHGEMSIQFRPPQIRKYPRQTFIGNDGLMVTGGGNWLKQTTNLFEVSVGNNGLRITNSSIQKQINGKWSNL